MNFFHRIGFVGTAIILWTVSAIGFFGSRFFTPLIVLGLPFWFPGCVVLGVDEVQERYGYWGEVFYDWLLSLPCVLVYAWLIHRRARRVVYHDKAANHALQRKGSTVTALHRRPSTHRQAPRDA